MDLHSVCFSTATKPTCISSSLLLESCAQTLSTAAVLPSHYGAHENTHHPIHQKTTISTGGSETQYAAMQSVNRCRERERERERERGAPWDPEFLGQRVQEESLRRPRGTNPSLRERLGSPLPANHREATLAYRMGLEIPSCN